MMLNTKVSYSPQMTFNSISGTLVKSCKESKITRFHMTSNRASYFFDIDKPRVGRDGKSIEVLQVMLCGEGEFLVEFKYKTTEAGE